MAVTRTLEQLAGDLRIGDGTTAPTGAEAVVLNRIADTAMRMVEDFAPSAPDAISNEAYVRLAGWLYDTDPSGRGVPPNALRASGAAALLGPYRKTRGQVFYSAGDSGAGAGGSGPGGAVRSDVEIGEVAFKNPPNDLLSGEKRDVRVAIDAVTLSAVSQQVLLLLPTDSEIGQKAFENPPGNLVAAQARAVLDAVISVLPQQTSAEGNVGALLAFRDADDSQWKMITLNALGASLDGDKFDLDYIPLNYQRKTPTTNGNEPGSGVGRAANAGIVFPADPGGNVGGDLATHLQGIDEALTGLGLSDAEIGDKAFSNPPNDLTPNERADVRAFIRAQEDLTDGEFGDIAFSNPPSDLDATEQEAVRTAIGASSTAPGGLSDAEIGDKAFSNPPADLDANEREAARTAIGAASTAPGGLTDEQIGDKAFSNPPSDLDATEREAVRSAIGAGTGSASAAEAVDIAVVADDGAAIPDEALVAPLDGYDEASPITVAVETGFFATYFPSGPIGIALGSIAAGDPGTVRIAGHATISLPGLSLDASSIGADVFVAWNESAANDEAAWYWTATRPTSGRWKRVGWVGSYVSGEEFGVWFDFSGPLTSEVAEDVFRDVPTDLSTSEKEAARTAIGAAEAGAPMGGGGLTFTELMSWTKTEGGSESSPQLGSTITQPVLDAIDNQTYPMMMVGMEFPETPPTQTARVNAFFRSHDLRAGGAGQWTRLYLSDSSCRIDRGPNGELDIDSPAGSWGIGDSIVIYGVS